MVATRVCQIKEKAMLVLIVAAMIVGVSVGLLWFFKTIGEWDEDPLGTPREH